MELPTTDLRFYAYNNGSTSGNYWFDTADTKEIRHHFANNCDKPSWSKDNSQLAMLCGDGVHFFEFHDGDWREMNRIARPDEINYLPDDFHMLNFPLWMNKGFAYFIDDRSMMNANTKRYPSYHPLYILSQECINDPQKCDLSQSQEVISDNSLGIVAVALSEDDQLLAVAFAAHEKGEIPIYDFQTFEVVNRIPLSTNEQDPNWGEVGSMIWGSQPNEIIISMNYYSGRIYRIPDYRKSEIDLLFDCPTAKVYNCSIRSKVTVK